MTTKNTNQVLTTTFETSEFTSATVTSTDIFVGRRQTNQQQLDKGNNLYNPITIFLKLRLKTFFV